MAERRSPEVQATWTADEQAAFWINAYNAVSVEIITRYYSIVSTNDIRIKSWLGSPISPWEKSLLTVGSRPYSLNDIENQMLRQRYRAPRVHFALVCASVSCPACWPKPTMAAAWASSSMGRPAASSTTPARTSSRPARWPFPTCSTGRRPTLAALKPPCSPTLTATPPRPYQPVPK
jgi:hypothetical protein